MKNNLIVFYDGWCPICIRFRDNIQSLDDNKIISFLDIRKNENNKFELDIEKSKKYMASIDYNNKLSYGFDSIFKIFKSIKKLWIFLPILFLISQVDKYDIINNELVLLSKTGYEYDVNHNGIYYKKIIKDNINYKVIDTILYDYSCKY